MSGIEILDRYLADIEANKGLDALEELEYRIDHLIACATRPNDDKSECSDCHGIINGGTFAGELSVQTLLGHVEDALKADKR